MVEAQLRQQVVMAVARHLRQAGMEHLQEEVMEHRRQVDTVPQHRVVRELLTRADMCPQRHQHQRQAAMVNNSHVHILKSR